MNQSILFSRYNEGQNIILCIPTLCIYSSTTWVLHEKKSLSEILLYSPCTHVHYYPCAILVLPLCYRCTILVLPLYSYSVHTTKNWSQFISDKTQETYCNMYRVSMPQVVQKWDIFVSMAPLQSVYYFFPLLKT